MARDQIQLPVDGAGKSHISFNFTEAGSPAPNAGVRHAQGFVVCDQNGNVVDVLTAAPAGTERGVAVRELGGTTVGTTRVTQSVGASYATATGNLTIAQPTAATPVAGGTVSSGAIPLAGNLTIKVSGTYAGVRLMFECDTGDGDWQPISCQREDSGISESDTGLLPANTTRLWTTAAPGMNAIRVRAVSWTSGTVAVRLLAGSYPFEPTVAAVVQTPPKTNVLLSTAIAGITTVTAEALLNLSLSRANAAAGAAAGTNALTAGKTFRIQSLTMSMSNNAGANPIRGQIALRYNSGGAVIVTSPLLATFATGVASSNIAQAGASQVWTFADGLDIPAGVTPGQIGVSHIASVATGLIWVTIVGYEF